MQFPLKPYALSNDKIVTGISNERVAFNSCQSVYSHPCEYSISHKKSYSSRYSTSNEPIAYFKQNLYWWIDA
jgi:hypothetical protein